jgi:ribosome-associated protein
MAPGSLRVGPLDLDPGELTWRFSRAGGPGGQGVNTTDSRVSVSFDVARSPAMSEPARARATARLGDRLVDGALTVTASEHRSQLANRRAALARLGMLLEQALAPPPKARRRTRPSRGSVERRLSSKKRLSDVKRMRRRPDY